LFSLLKLTVIKKNTKFYICNRIVTAYYGAVKLYFPIFLFILQKMQQNKQIILYFYLL